MSHQTIADVLTELDAIVGQCRREGSRLGYFAALYRKVTRAVQQGIGAGRFEDGARMERLDVLFARRYLDAFAQFQRGERPTRSWQHALEQGENPHLLVLQHLLLGMNAHINLDLGIAAAQAAPGPALPALQRDFDAINALLAGLLAEVEGDLGQVSPVMAVLNRVVTHTDDIVCNFSMAHARRAAWEVATRLAPLTPAQQEPLIAQLDRRTTLRAHLLCAPDPFPNLLHCPLRQAELPDVRWVIDALC